jgi:hypothetical protein
MLYVSGFKNAPSLNYALLGATLASRLVEATTVVYVGWTFIFVLNGWLWNVTSLF